jgi:hypothetical protein
MKVLGGLVAIVVIVICAVLGWHMEYGTQRDVTFTVKQLDDQASGSSHKYLVFTRAGHVMENTDAWLHGKMDSSNVQALFSQGKTYTCPIYGFRFFLFSSYPDILDGCKAVPAGTPTTY